jgi:hypothetical protein
MVAAELASPAERPRASTMDSTNLPERSTHEGADRRRLRRRRSAVQVPTVVSPMDAPDDAEGRVEIIVVRAPADVDEPSVLEAPVLESADRESQDGEPADEGSPDREPLDEESLNGESPDEESPAAEAPEGETAENETPEDRSRDQPAEDQPAGDGLPEDNFSEDKAPAAAVAATEGALSVPATGPVTSFLARAQGWVAVAVLAVLLVVVFLILGAVVR